MQNHIFELKKKHWKEHDFENKSKCMGSNPTYNLYARGFRYINTMPFENHLDINSLKLGDCANHIRSITWLLCELPDGNTYHFKHFKFTQKPTHPPFGSTKSHILKIFNSFTMKEKARMNEWKKERKPMLFDWWIDEVLI